MAPEANSFGVLRFLMAALVLISHSYLFGIGTDQAEPLTAWTGHSLGEHAVQVFFILSGILVAQSFDRSRSLLDFASARVLRIFPGLIVCVLLTALVLGPVMSRLGVLDYFAGRELPLYLLKTLSLSTGSAPLPALFEAVPMAKAVNTSLWTLKYEVLCYAAMAMAGLAGLFKPRWRTLSAALLAMFLVLVFAGDPKPLSTYSFSDNARYFALYFGTGMLAYLLRDRLVITGFLMLPLFALFVMALETRFAELATAAFLGYGVVWAASKTFGPLRTFCNRLDLSFGVYIYAGPIQQALIETLPGASPLVISALAFVAVLPLALLSWIVVEKPSLDLRHRLWRQRRACVSAKRLASVIGRSPPVAVNR